MSTSSPCHRSTSIRCRSLLRVFLPAILPLVLATLLSATDAPGVQLKISPDRADWTYLPGEPARFIVTASADGKPLANAEINYSIGLERMPALSNNARLGEQGNLDLDAGTLEQPGFLRGNVSLSYQGKDYRALTTAAYSPEKIRPTQTEPDDFDAFWQKGLEDLKKLPLEPEITRFTGNVPPAVDLYYVSFRSMPHLDANGKPSESDARVHGVLSLPKKPGRYPGVLYIPGAGVNRRNGEREPDAITLQIGVHGIPVNQPNEYYKKQYTGPLKEYYLQGLDSPLQHYYRRVILGCVRALDFLVSRPEYDGNNLSIIGGSQGGFLALATTALDSRVKSLVVRYPAYCDVTGYLHGRAGGWPHMFAPRPGGASNPNATPERIATTGYYDSVNFARRIRVPGHYSWGYNDEVCPPTSIYAAYNLISAPKDLSLVLEAGHRPTDVQLKAARLWLASQRQ